MQQYQTNKTTLPTPEQWADLQAFALQVEKEFFNGDVDSYLNSLESQE